MSRPQATPNKHKTDWLAVIGGLLAISLIGACLVECADRQIVIEQASQVVSA